MADISITPLAPRAFQVQVREGQRETTHRVTVPERLGERLELREDDLERVVRKSFRFLLRCPVAWPASEDSASRRLITNADYPDNRSPNVATIRPDGSHLRLLTHFSDGQRGAFAGSYSPDGRWIVIRVENRETQRFALFKIHPDGSGSTLIARLPFSPRFIDWGPRPSHRH